MFCDDSGGVGARWDCVVTVETDWMTSPIVVDLCDSTSPRGRAPLGGKAKGIVLHVQTKQPLASGLSKAPLVTYLCDTSKMGFCYSLSLYTQPHKRCEFIGWELHGRADLTNSPQMDDLLLLSKETWSRKQ